MSKKLYNSLIALFVVIFLIGMNMLLGTNEDYDLELWSYYSGGQNQAVEDFNQNSEYHMKFTGIAADNFTTKVDTALAAGELPDIIMVDASDLGRYVSNDEFMDFNQVFEDSKSYQQYKNNASQYGLSLGQYEQQQKAIKFENSSSIFAYRSDLASQCLGIDSPTEMNQATQRYQDYTKLYEKLQNSDDLVCSSISLFATNEYTNFILNPNNIITDNQLNPKLTDWLNWIKENLETKLVYSRYGQYHELIDDSGETAFFGDITTVNHLRDFYDFDQPGQWAIAQTPINYQGNTSYFLIAKDANIEAVKAFFEQTFFDQNWLESNIDDIGIIENQQVMNQTNYTGIDLNGYFTNDNLQSELNVAATKTIGNNHPNTSNYDYGIRNTMTGVVNDYIDNKLKSEDVDARIKSDLETFYKN